jgi:putative Mg2+ transporter-C (MgtC) family protein
MSTADQLDLFLWVLLALGLGGLVGLEREIRGHEAGVRTNALVCAGAAIFGQVSLALGDTRIAAGVVQGIGFLGAGLVFQRGNNVHGITTAATIWVMAAIGLLIGGEIWLLPILLTVTLIVVLEAAPGSDAILRFSRRRGLAHGDAQPSDVEDQYEEDEPLAKPKAR